MTHGNIICTLMCGLSSWRCSLWDAPFKKEHVWLKIYCLGGLPPSTAFVQSTQSPGHCHQARSFSHMSILAPVWNPCATSPLRKWLCKCQATHGRVLLNVHVLVNQWPFCSYSMTDRTPSEHMAHFFTYILEAPKKMCSPSATTNLFPRFIVSQCITRIRLIIGPRRPEDQGTVFRIRNAPFRPFSTTSWNAMFTPDAPRTSSARVVRCLSSKVQPIYRKWVRGWGFVWNFSKKSGFLGCVLYGAKSAWNGLRFH